MPWEDKTVDKLRKEFVEASKTSKISAHFAESSVSVEKQGTNGLKEVKHPAYLQITVTPHFTYPVKLHRK